VVGVSRHITHHTMIQCEWLSHIIIASSIFLPSDINQLSTNYQLSTINDQPTRVYRLPTTDYRLPTTDYGLPTTHYPLPTTDYRLRILSVIALGPATFSPIIIFLHHLHKRSRSQETSNVYFSPCCILIGERGINTLSQLVPEGLISRHQLSRVVFRSICYSSGEDEVVAR
jgi:hypothetical protein